MDDSIGGECCKYLTIGCGRLVFNTQDCQYLKNRCEKLVLTRKPLNTRKIGV